MIARMMSKSEIKTIATDCVGYSINEKKNKKTSQAKNVKRTYKRCVNWLNIDKKRKKECWTNKENMVRYVKTKLANLKYVAKIKRQLQIANFLNNL